MFLALKEMNHSKLRYSLIIGIMFLISFVVFFLSGLANGLAQEFKQVVNDWDAQHIILSEESNKVLAASQLNIEDLDKVDSTEKAPLSLYNGALISNKNKTNISFFGTEDTAFFLPKMTEGHSFTKDNEIIISDNLARQGFKLGDTLTLGTDDINLTIVGIFPDTSFIVTPVIYGTMKTATNLKFGSKMFTDTTNYPINAILTDTEKTTLTGDTLDMMSPDTFIQNLPGYSEQSLTLNAMIYFLFVIAAAIIGIFMYVMTLQKTPIFGVMKVQGISTFFISKSIIAQSFLVGLIGAGLAGIISVAMGSVLPDAMPFAIVPSEWVLYGVVLIFVSMLGGLFSTITVNKVDPIKAIGG